MEANLTFEDDRPFKDKYGDMTEDELMAALERETVKSDEMSGWDDQRISTA